MLGRLSYDADCGFCTWSLERGRRLLPDLPQTVPFQQIQRTTLTPQQLARAVWFVDAAGGRWSGHRAIAEVLRRQPRRTWRLLGRAMTIPPVSWLAALVYRWVAGHRHRLPGASAACAVPPPPDG